MLCVKVFLPRQGLLVSHRQRSLRTGLRAIKERPWPACKQVITALYGTPCYGTPEHCAPRLRDPPQFQAPASPDRAGPEEAEGRASLSPLAGR